MTPYRRRQRRLTAIKMGIGFGMLVGLNVTLAIAFWAGWV